MEWDTARRLTPAGLGIVLPVAPPLGVRDSPEVTACARSYSVVTFFGLVDLNNLLASLNVRVRE
jgi:hypothetical protein